MNTVRHIRTIIIFFALLMGVTSEAWAQEPTLTASDIIIAAGIEHGSVAVKSVDAQTRTVTLTVTPSAGYCIQKSDIVVQKLVDPAVVGAPRRVPEIANLLAVSGPTKSKIAADYTFVVPTDYAGAMVTVTFRQLAAATVTVTPNGLIYTGSAQELVTLGTVVGTKFDNGTKLTADAPLAGYYTKSYDVYTPCNADDLANGTTTYYKPLVTYSDTENGTYSSTIPTGTNVDTYTVYYKYVADDSHADGSGSVTVVINKAPITSVELNESVQRKSDSAILFSIASVKAGDVTVPSSDYDVSGDALTTQTEVGTYTCTVTAKPASTTFTGSASVTFRIVEASTVFVNSSTVASDITNQEGKMAANYILTSDISASILAGLYSESADFTGELDGNFHKITGLSGHGLFNTISDDGKVKNVILEDVNITTGDPTNGDAGAICNVAKGNARIYNCGILSTDVVYNDDGSVKTINATSGSKVSGTRYVGGLVGLLDGSARVINCYSYASITGGTHKAGIVGYNNYASKYDDLKTMVMNCMFYGDISLGGTERVPIYGGKEISNENSSRLNNYNYFVYEAPFSINNSTTNPIITKYNCALAAEERYLVRFEFYRNLVNSTRELASWYVFGSVQTDAHDKIAKWVLDPSIAPYPILKPQGYYPSVVNYDPDYTYDKDRNRINRYAISERAHGKQLGTLSVTINLGSGYPEGASITKGSLTLNRIDKDTLNYNFNYDKVQLPYYNDVGTGNYTKNKVVTGWKITAMVGGTQGSFSTSYDAPGYNFADRTTYAKDLYGQSERVFSQGAYFDVPDGVTGITIEPYWGFAAYLSDEGYDAYYTSSNDTWKRYNVNSTASIFGQRYTNATSTFNGDQLVYTSFTNALARLDALGRTTSTTVYDYAVVLVGNYHHKGMPEVPVNNVISKKHFSVMSVDFNYDNEPDYSLIIHSGKQEQMSPIRFDFINVPGAAMAHKITSYTYMGILGNMKFNGWFETTNTTNIHFSQFEYDSEYKSLAPLILMGGIVDMFTSTNGQEGATTQTTYIHVGGNVYFKLFNNGCHMDKKTTSTPHRPISVTGGDYKKFYLSGYLQPNAPAYTTADGGQNAECYISGGRFGEVAGAGYEQISGDVTWQIFDADMQSFFGGGINENKAITGNISTTIRDSYVKLFCGGPKFGNMADTKTVTTNATNCEFGTYFGAGYGGTAITRVNAYNHYNSLNYTWNGTHVEDNKSEKITPKFSDSGTDYSRGKYIAGKGISISYDYENFEGSNVKTVAYLFVNYASLSVAQTNGVTSTLTGCTINKDFYGGGSLGTVVGDATSTLTNCTVLGSAYGAGFSASVPTASVFPAQGFKEPVPFYNSTTGVFEPGGGYPDAVPYTWSNDEGSNTNTLVDDDDNDKHYIHVDKATVDLSSLGTVTGKVTLNIAGTTTVAGSVYGGGEESVVDGSTEVNVNSGTIGTVGQGGAKYGNVYGGGMGKDDDVLAGIVKGNTKVTISQAEGKTTTVYHNVYGGGAYGSVGTYTYDGNNVITGYTENTGKAEVIITGGTIGTTGKDNGMVFGSSRGDVDAPGSIQDRLAWVHDTHVVIGTAGQGFDAPQPQIKGSVYGSGENGHTYNDAEVIIHSGTIGIASGVKVTDDSGKEYEGAAYPYRGNVYGGGCGTDTYPERYDSDGDDDIDDNDDVRDAFNSLAGIVQGNATVTITGGHVVHNIYGAGAMGSVGVTNTDGTISGGQTTINISGGQIGVSGTVEDGNVFGAARGSAEATSNEYALVRNYTTVNISGKASVKGNVYGGGELGCVGTFTISDGMRTFTWQDTDGNTNTPANTDNKNTGICNVNISGGTIGTGVVMSDDGSYTNGNVFGAGKGKDDTFWCEKGIVYKANVSITDGTVNGNVYGGGEVGRVETDATVKIGPDTGIGSPDVKGNVFGGGAGVKTHGYSALVRGNTYVTVQSSAKVSHNVYGGGQIAAVGKYYLVTAENLDQHPGLSVGMPYSLVNEELGICNVTVKGNADITGSVFGGGKGKEPDNLNFAKPSGSDYHTESYDIDDHMPKRMMNDYANKNTYWEYSNPPTNTIIWEYFETKEKYETFLETLGLTTQSVVNIEGSAQVSGNVYGGSESGFVQHHTSVTIAGGTIGTGTAGGNVFGGGLGLAAFAEAGRVRGNATVTINNGTVKGNVYGGGEMGDVGTIVKNTTNYNYLWTNDPDSNPDNYEWNETGVCTVTINGGTIGTGVDPRTDGTYANGNVFGAGKGKADTYWCEKAIAYKTNVTVTNGTINGTVYGGGEVGRVETDGITTIGKSGETGTGSKPYIKGNVFGAGAGVKTHGYSALLRGNSKVTVQGIAKVGHSVYGGGEIASVGRFYVDPATQLPTTPRSGGTCTVTIQGSAEIGSDGEGYVFGACKGVTPSYNYSESETTYDYRIANFSKRMVTYAPNRAENPHVEGSKGSFWDPYPNENTENPSFVWEYLTTPTAYKVFLNTLALTSNTKVTIGGGASVNGSVFGGGERGITLGSVVVNVVGGNVTKDVYGGGALADSNAGNVTGYGTSSATISSTSTYTTTVNLLGGTINDAYGGALGQKVGDVNGGTSDIEAFVYGDVNVNLNGVEASDYIATDHESYVTDVDETDGGTYYRATDGCIVTGNVFGCNNINGTPKGHSKVHVFKTKAKTGQAADGYDVAKVFGGGNAADYVPAESYTQQTTEVIIEGCDLTSIEEVYGGGYGAATPGTKVLIKGTKIIDNVFGGGYGAGSSDPTAADYNPGANVGFRTGGAAYASGEGKAIVQLMAGKVNNVYGGSNTQGDIRGGSSVTNTASDGSPGCCATLDVGKIFGGGKSAAMYGGAEIVLGCMPNDWIEEIYAGADQADVGNDVSLTITSGKFGRVFGGNNTSGTISGSIEVNIEENPECGTPIIIGELYGGGNQAPYTVPQDFIDDWKTDYGADADYPSPRVNVRAFTSIGNIYGGGLGKTAIVTGNPTVNINEVEGGREYGGETKTLEDGTKVMLYPRAATGTMGVIGNVFGGGNAAQVVGSTYVNIGTKTGENIEFESLTDDTSTTDINEKKKRVVGADIRGNIFGGGNQAGVTGDTNVTIGKKRATP